METFNQGLEENEATGADLICDFTSVSCTECELKKYHIYKNIKLGKRKQKLFEPSTALAMPVNLLSAFNVFIANII